MFDPIVPFKFSGGDPASMLDALRCMRHDYGIRRFLITAPNQEVLLGGDSSLDAFREIGRMLSFIRRETAAEELQVGWWCTPSLGAGVLNASWTRIVDLNGTESVSAGCPLDPDFRADFAGKVAEVAMTGHPWLILFEDDFELSNHAGIRFGCFCPRHLEEFARRTGKFRTREELCRIFSAGGEKAQRLRLQYHMLACDTMKIIARDIRRAVDQVAPETRLGLCQPGVVDLDGDFTWAVARELAGEKTRPFVRVFGACYSSCDSGQKLPGALAHAFYSAEHPGGDLEIVHETDTYPHTRFFASGAFIDTLLTGAFSAGCRGTLFYATQYLDEPLEERGYLELLRKRRPKWEAFLRQIAGTELCGWQIVRSSRESCAVPFGRTDFQGRLWDGHGADWLGRCGIPYTTREQPVKLLSGITAAVLTDEEIMAILAGGVLLDAEAAVILTRRGYDSYLGVTAEPLPEIDFCREKILWPGEEVDSSRRSGRDIYVLAFAPAGSEAAAFARLTPQPRTQWLTAYCDSSGRRVQPGMTFFSNRAGGRVAVSGGVLWKNNSSQIFCYRKKALLQHLYTLLSGGELLPAAECIHPNFWVLCNRAPIGGDQRLTLTLTNLSCDGAAGVSLRLATEWRQRRWQELGGDGFWRGSRTREKDGVLTLPGYFNVLSPRIFRCAN